METSSIKSIKSLLTEIQQNLDAFGEFYKAQGSAMDVCSYGSEKEYSLKGIIGGVKNILTDIGFLARSHNLFLKFSTYAERNEMIQYLQNMNSYLINRQIPNVVVSIEALKSKLRTYNLRSDRERLVDYSEALDDLCRKAIELQESINDVKKKLTQASKTYNKIEEKQTEYSELIQELSNKKDEFVEEYDTFVKEVGDFRDLAEKAKTNEQTVAIHLKQVEEDKDVFDEFIEKIDDREKVLERQDAATKVYEKKIEEFEQDHKKKLNDVSDLIEKAMQALQYTTATGMSAAFSSQYQNANKWYYKVGWLVGASCFVMLTLLIGAWIVTGYGIEHKTDTMWFSLIGRLSMIPFTIYAAIFCSQQYIKQKNLIEDYAYKTVLSKSIIAFSEELRKNDPEKYAEYLSTVLREIHQDPLRKRGKEKDEEPYKESANLLDKAINLAQMVLKQNGE